MGISLAPTTAQPPKVPQTEQATDPNALTPTAKPAVKTQAAPQTQQTSTAIANHIPLASSQPSAAPAAPGTPDRVGLALSSWDTFAKATDPTYQKSLRDATSMAASKGQLGSGQLRTSYGDLASNRALALDTERQSLLDKATGDSIGDQFTQQGIDLAKGGLTGSYGGEKTLGAQQLDLARETGLGSLDLAKQQFGLSQQLGLGTLSIQQAAQKLNEMVQTGQLTLDQAKQAYAEKQSEQQFGLQEGSLTGSYHGQQTASASEFAQQLAQQLGLAQMSDKTQNRGIDANAALAQNDLYLKIAQLLAGMGFPTNGIGAKNTGSAPGNGGNGGNTTPPTNPNGGTTAFVP